ncbi:hypothetical protein GCM10028811_31360 [Uliginosibacterium sediminicola]
MASFFALLATPAQADLRLSSEWKADYNVNPIADEASPLEPAALEYAKQFNAVDVATGWGKPANSLAFQLYFGETKYYIQPLSFMAKDRPDEVCTPKDYSGQPTYQCEQGQRYKYSCHLLFFNAKYQPVGAFRIRINESSEVFCNAMPAMGVYDKTRNELLVTSQYFPIDRKAASKASEVGANWMRMTSLFRLREEGGKILVEQDDACLKNPNRYETIPDARKALRACSSQALPTK